jgi:hypothetical protein
MPAFSRKGWFWVTPSPTPNRSCRWWTWRRNPQTSPTQIPVATDDMDETTFTSHEGTYRFRRIPFGLRNAPATFQRTVEIVLSGLTWKSCLVYLDDIIIYSKTMDAHVGHLDGVLNLLGTAWLSLKFSKRFFFNDTVDYLGHVIIPGKLAIAVKKHGLTPFGAFAHNANRVAILSWPLQFLPTLRPRIFESRRTTQPPVEKW